MEGYGSWYVFGILSLWEGMIDWWSLSRDVEVEEA